MLTRIHRDNMAGLREGPICDVASKLREGGYSLGLQPVVLGSEIAIHLSVARQMTPVLAQNILGKKVLRVTAWSSAHRPEQEVKPCGNRAGDLNWNHLDLDCEGPRLLIAPAFVE